MKETYLKHCLFSAGSINIELAQGHSAENTRLYKMWLTEVGAEVVKVSSPVCGLQMDGAGRSIDAVFALEDRWKRDRFWWSGACAHWRRHRFCLLGYISRDGRSRSQFTVASLLSCAGYFRQRRALHTTARSHWALATSDALFPAGGRFRWDLIVSQSQRLRLLTS